MSDAVDTHVPPPGFSAKMVTNVISQWLFPLLPHEVSAALVAVRDICASASKEGTSFAVSPVVYVSEWFRVCQ
jgi:hypothetical protein